MTVRIVSLLPSATDLVCMLGLRQHLVGRTHECDWPPGIEEVPVMTASALPTEAMGSREIDEAIGGRVHSGSSIYTLDTAALREAKPDLILTQELCEVCAVSYGEVRRAARVLDADVRVVSLEPRTIREILDNATLVGSLTGTEERAAALVADANERLDGLRRLTGARERIRTVCVEWLDPPYAAGHWVPEQVAAAGGHDPVARAGEPSRRVEWDEIAAAAPGALVVMPCGLSIERTLAEIGALTARPGWDELPAVRSGRVWAVDGPSFFNRPGPRVVRGAEILAALLHPATSVVNETEAVTVG